jgi:hypothetical protein
MYQSATPEKSSERSASSAPASLRAVKILKFRLPRSNLADPLRSRAANEMWQADVTHWLLVRGYLSKESVGLVLEDQAEANGSEVAMEARYNRGGINARRNRRASQRFQALIRTDDLLHVPRTPRGRFAGDSRKSS